MVGLNSLQVFSNISDWMISWQAWEASPVCMRLINFKVKCKILSEGFKCVIFKSSFQPKTFYDSVITALIFFPVPCSLLCIFYYFLFLSAFMTFISCSSYILIYQVSTLVSNIYLLMLSSLPPEHSLFTKHFTIMDVNRLNSEDYCSKTDPSLSCECAVFALSEMEDKQNCFQTALFQRCLSRLVQFCSSFISRSVIAHC